MSDHGGLGDAILLRLADRIHTLEQQTATQSTQIAGLTENVADIRKSISRVSHEVEDVRRTYAEACQSFEQMRKPLEGLLELRQRFTGGWLLATALLMAVAYLFQPLLADLYHWHMGGH